MAIIFTIQERTLCIYTPNTLIHKINKAYTSLCTDLAICSSYYPNKNMLYKI